MFLCFCLLTTLCFFFFFQAEDGIRDHCVTGVQTCALPIYSLGKKVCEAFANYEKENGKKLDVWFEPGKYLVSEAGYFVVKANVIKQTTATRSEERRVGKECRYRWSPYQ